MSHDVLDLEEIVRLWAVDLYNATVEGPALEEIKSSDIDWSGVRIRHETTEYSDQINQSIPKTHILSTAHFNNDTDHPKVFNLHSERSTKSICSVSFDRTYSIGINMDIRLRPPNPVVEANAGFKGEKKITSSNMETFEEVIVWSVNNPIVVPPKYKVKAELALKEQEQDYNFKCKTRFQGKVRVKLRTKKGSHGYPMVSLVRDIFRPKHGFQVDEIGVYFVSNGTCKSRYGLEQLITLHQTPIDDEFEVVD